MIGSAWGYSIRMMDRRRFDLELADQLQAVVDSQAARVAQDALAVLLLAEVPMRQVV